MADLPEALDEALRARYGLVEVRTPATTRRGLMARMNQLEKLHTQKGDRPGQAAHRAARSAGISPTTWNRWRTGKQQPSAAALGKLTTAHRDQVTLPKLRRSLKKAGVPTMVRVTAEVRWNGYYNQTPQRSIKFGPGRMKGVMRLTIRAWALDGPQAAAEAFERGISAAQDPAVPDERDYPEPGDISPGIQFEGDNVTIEFED